MSTQQQLVLISGAPKTGRSPSPSVSPGQPLVLRPTLHQVKHPEGQHYFRMVDGAWVCACGEHRDRNGRPLR